MKKHAEVKNNKINSKTINGEIVESVDNRLSNKIVTSPVRFDGPLNWREIVRFQTEKEEILRDWFNETGYWPNTNSTPVFDVTDNVVYPSYSLIVPTDEGGVQIFAKIKDAVLNKKPASWDWYSINVSRKIIDKFDKHIFIGASDVDSLILFAALENYKKAKAVKEEKEQKFKAQKEVLDKTLSKLKELEQEILDLQSK